MRILHIVTGLQKASGVTTFVENIVAELRALGNEVDVVTKASDPSASLQLYTAIKSNDVIHLHGLWDLWLHRWAKAARKAGVKVVWSPHGMLTPWALKYKGWKKFAALALYQWNDLHHADALHVTAVSEVADVRRLGLKNQVIVAPLGVKMPDLCARSPGGGGYILLFVSRVQRKKGLVNLVRAWGWLLNKLLFTGRVTPIKGLANAIAALPSVDGWRLRIVGPDQEGHTDELKALAAEAGVADRIDFVGPKYGDELAQEYLKADCFILPSFSENFGSVVVEALAAGLPVITSKGTPWEELVARRCGWWVENDPETLARTLREMMALSDAERREMGARGRALVEEKYQWPAIGRQMAEEYRKLIYGTPVSL